MRAFGRKTVLAAAVLWAASVSLAAAQNQGRQEQRARAEQLRAESITRTELPPDRTLQALLERIDDAEERGDLETALAQTALAMVLGAKLEARFLALLEKGTGQVFADNLARAWRTVNPAYAPASPLHIKTQLIVESDQTAPATEDLTQDRSVPKFNVESGVTDESGLKVNTRTALLSAPRFSAAPIKMVLPGTKAQRLQRFGVWSQVALSDGTIGFVPTRTLRSARKVAPVPEPKPEFGDEIIDASAEIGELGQIEPAAPPRPKPSRSPADEGAILVSAAPSDPEEAEIIAMSPVQPIWIRQGPGTENEPLGTVVPGERLSVGQIEGAWARVTTESGLEGYVGVRWLEPI